MKAKDAIKTIRGWAMTEKKDKIEALYKMYKVEFGARQQIRFQGAIPSEGGLIGLGKEMELWIDSIRLRGEFEWLSPLAGKVMYHFMYPRKENRKPDPDMKQIQSIFKESVKDLAEHIVEGAKAQVAQETENIKNQVSVITGVPKDMIEVEPRKETATEAKKSDAQKTLETYAIIGAVALGRLDK